MGIISAEFFAFAAAAILIYYLFPAKKYQWTVLLAASYVYYILNCNKYVVYMLVTTVSTYFGALLIGRIAEKSKQYLLDNRETLTKESRKAFKARTQKNKRLALAAVLVFNFGILAFLKYFGFCADTVHSLLGIFGVNYTEPKFNFIVPLGISFYTFQSMGYVIDVYRGKVSAEKNFGKLALFVSFFPQIVQGPIGIYSDLAHQLYEPKKFSYERFKSGGLLILWGIFKKLLIADRAVKVIKLVTADSGAFSGTYILFTVILYAVQLYADFSGGIDICRGIAEIMGITMAENFKRPYFSKTLTEYWHRWHISLGDWLRNYLFYPISLSKPFLKMSKSMKKHGLKYLGKVFPVALASLITFIVIGIWHGSQTKYIAFGLWNGLVIMISSLLKPLTDKLTEKLRINRENIFYSAFCMVRTFIVVLIGYYFDIARGFKDAVSMIWRSIADIHFADLASFSCLKKSGVDKFDYIIILAGCAVLFVISIVQETKKDSVRNLLCKKSLPLQWLLYILLIAVIAVFGYYGPGTTPADFVYMQF